MKHIVKSGCSSWSGQSSLADISICGRVNAPDQTNLAWITPDPFAVVLLM
jgi:hypothetical protein